MANSAFTHDPQITVPASSTDNAVVIFDGTAGTGFGNSTIIVDSGGNGRIGIAADTNVITLTSGVVTIAGTVAATTLTGAGAGITALAAGNITASGTLPALNGAALTALSAANITASGTLPALNGAALTALNGSQITTGTVADARISALTASKLTGALPAISGANLTNLPAGGITVNGTTDNALVTYDNGNTRLNTESTITYDGTNLLIGAYLQLGGQSTSVSKNIQFRTTNGAEYEIEYRNAGLNFSEVGVAHYRLHIKDDGDVTVLENASSPSVTKGIAKLWCAYTTSGTVGIVGTGYNVASVSDGSGTGEAILDWTVDFENEVGNVYAAMGNGGAISIGTDDANTAGGINYVTTYNGTSASDQALNRIVGFGEAT